MADRDEEPPIPVTRDEVRRTGRVAPIDGDQARQLFMEEYERKRQAQRLAELQKAEGGDPRSNSYFRTGLKCGAALGVLYFIMFM